MTRRRRIVLLVLTWLAVPLLLIGAEIALRLFDTTLDNSLTRPVTVEGREWLEINRGYLRRYFPPGTPLIPEFKPALMHAVKPPGAIRIFCLGGSSMFGTPYQMTATIPGVLRKQLRHVRPEADIEVLNFGASAINSNVLLDLSRELRRYRPDMVVLYAGHNEFYGPDGIGAGPLERAVPPAIQWKYRLRDSRVAAWLLRLLGPEDVPAERNLMREVSRGGAVALASEEAQRVFDLWESNLTDILGLWREGGVPVIVSDVSSNLLFPPFLYDTLALAAPALERLRRAGGIPPADREEVSGALADLRRKEPGNAFVSYWSGRLALLAGDTAAARALLCRARDLDLLKFRAPERINEITRAVCRRLDVPCISTDSLFASLSPAGIPGDALFWEHLHPTLRGYYEIGTRYAGEMVRREWIGPGGRTELLPFDPDSLGVCWLDRAYGDLSIRHLTGRWPFTGYVREPDVLRSADSAQIAIAKAVYDRRLDWDRGCYESAALFWRRGDLRSAATTYSALVDEYAYSFYPRYLLGNILAKMGEKEAAVMHLLRSIGANPAYPQSRLDLGLLLINEGRFDEAVEHLSEAARLPAAQASHRLHSAVLYGLGAAYANRGDLPEARQTLEEAVRLDSANTEARALLRLLGR